MTTLWGWLGVGSNGKGVRKNVQESQAEDEDEANFLTLGDLDFEQEDCGEEDAVEVGYDA